MKKIFENKRKVAEFDRGIIAGYASSDRINTHLVGELKLDEVLDLLHTLEHEYLTTFVKNIKDKAPELTEEKIRKQLYDRSVYGYSLMIDKFLKEDVTADEVLRDRPQQSPLSPM